MVPGGRTMWTRAQVGAGRKTLASLQGRLILAPSVALTVPLICHSQGTLCGNDKPQGLDRPCPIAPTVSPLQSSVPTGLTPVTLLS